MQVLSEPRTKVNGKFLFQFNGKPVSLLGRVLKVHSSGSSFELKSTDNQVITVILNEPLTENLEGWVEVRGNGQGRSNIICHYLIQLNNVIYDSFDVDLYDDVINVINSCNNPWVNSEIQCRLCIGKYLKIRQENPTSNMQEGQQKQNCKGY